MILADSLKKSDMSLWLCGEIHLDTRDSLQSMLNLGNHFATSHAWRSISTAHARGTYSHENVAYDILPFVTAGAVFTDKLILTFPFCD